MAIQSLSFGCKQKVNFHTDMEALIIAPTKSSPAVNFDPTSGMLKLSGRSFPSDSVGFYSPVVKWLKEYFSKPAASTKIICCVEYYNTSSKRSMLNLLKEVEKSSVDGHKIEVVWQYYNDDEDMLEIGKELEKFLKLVFEYEIVPR